MKKIVLSALVAAVAVSSTLAAVVPAAALLVRGSPGAERL